MERINFVGEKLNQNDAVNFWNIASLNLWKKKAEDYINRNGKFYNNIGEIVKDFPQYKEQIKEKVKTQFKKQYKEQIKEKVKTQFKKDDVPAIVFHENSSVAKAISKSAELNDFIYKNVSALKNGKEVSGSLGFTSDSNLHSAFGKVDVLSAKLQGKFIEFILLDTYDFNPNEKNWKVQMGYSAQKAGLLNPYFTIVKVKYKI